MTQLTTLREEVPVRSVAPDGPLERTMRTHDGTELFYRVWLPAQPTDRAVVLFHRGHEHSGRLLDLVRDLDLEDFAVFAWDARGNGRSPGRRDWAESFSVYVRDAEAFVRHVSDTYDIPVSNMAVMASSVGAVIASTWVHDYAPPVRALVLATPAFDIKLYVPFAIPMLRLARRLGLVENVTSYVKARVLTHDRAQQRAFNDDPAITNSIATDILLDCFDTGRRVVDDAGVIRVPTLMQVAGADWVVRLGAQRRFFENLGAERKEWRYYPDLYHAIYHEDDRQRPIAAARDFILDVFHNTPRPAPPLSADRWGSTRREYERLSLPSRNPLHAVTRDAMKTCGRLSAGIRLGWARGFDSGVSLDYVYANDAAGWSPLGRLIDRFYLDSVGWRGIRQRRVHLEAMLERAIRDRAEATRAVHVVDLAAGPGRYHLETLRRLDDLHVTATLRDVQEVNLEAGRALAAEFELDDRVRYEHGDAFDHAALAALDPRPSVCVVSGLYELFPDNTPLRTSLSGLADVIHEGGLLIYTNQPWHPQVEFIARVLRNRDGEPWIMRRRSQEEIDALVGEAGFEKIEMSIDRWGIFTVSLARRRPS